MATAPQFITTPKVGVAAVSTANTNRDGTGTIVDIITGASNGTRINEVIVKTTGNPADSVVTLYIYSGSTYYLFDEFDLGDPDAASTTVTGYRESREYENLVLPSGVKLAAAITVALTSGVINVFALGGDL